MLMDNESSLTALIGMRIELEFVVLRVVYVEYVFRRECFGVNKEDFL